MRDPRFPGLRRRLRRVFPDPLTGKDDWGVLRAPGGGIVGVYSKSERKPLKFDMFAPEYAAFANKEKYSDWVFAYVPPGPALPGASTGAAPTARTDAQPAAPVGNPGSPATTSAPEFSAPAPIAR